MHSLKNRLSGLIVLSSCLLLLGACSTVDGMGRDISNIFGSEEVEEPKIVSNFDDRYYDSRYDQVATEMSDTNVQLYGLDGNAAKPRPNGREDYVVQGSNTSDPSVTVFSLEDGRPVTRGFEQPQRMETYYDFQRQQGTVTPLPNNSGDISFVPVTRKTQPAQGGGEVGWFSTMPHRIYFDHDSKELTQSGYKVIDHIAQRYQGQSLAVEGHASERAEQASEVERKVTNLKVSMDRALSVSRALMHKGVPADSIETKAYGDTRPPLASQGMSPEAAARRVEIRSE